MKIATGPYTTAGTTQAILAGGQYLKIDLYQILLATGESFYFTAGDQPSITVGTATSLSTVGTAQTYVSGMTINRGSTDQKVGLDAQEMDVTWAPKFDNPGGAPLIAGYNIMTAGRLGVLDNATITYSKLFCLIPAPGAPLVVSQGAVSWFVGVVAEMEIQRFSLQMKVSSNLLVLNTVQMPRNLYQATCSHTVYDAGCQVSKSAFTVSGTVGTVTSTSQFNTNLTQADNWFNLGVITFTSGANYVGGIGFSSTVKLFTHASGVLQVILPFPNAVTAGDTFTIYPGCDRLQATCTTKFSNLQHFKGFPYVPVPETLYDGGSTQPVAGTAQPSGGSGPGGRIIPR